YFPLRNAPIAITIQTKTPDGNVEEAMEQLSAWATAYFNRLRALLRPIAASEPVSIVLPIISVSGADWNLKFARDCYYSIDIIDSATIGSTTTIVGCYKILYALRLLFDWITTTFRFW
ncbi:hypothetical protein K505DRAFT_223479, partial [Melanomma pulvis-pyrius CBS 109.77]